MTGRKLGKEESSVQKAHVMGDITESPNVRSATGHCF